MMAHLIWVSKAHFIVRQFICLRRNIAENSITIIGNSVACMVPYTRLRLQKSYGDFVYSNYKWRIFYRRNNQSHLLARLMQIVLHSQFCKFCSAVVFSCRPKMIAALNTGTIIGCKSGKLFLPLLSTLYRFVDSIDTVFLLRLACRHIAVLHSQQ